MFSSFVFISVFLLLCCYACSGHADYFKIEGRLRNISQGEFYLYNTTGAMTKIDTIIVQDGRFAHQTFINKPATLILVFPNFSELPIFASPGSTAKIKGDVSHLKELQVTGTKANKLMTTFRQSIANLPPPEVLRLAEEFIKENPQSEVSNHLIEKYFIRTADADYPRAVRLLNTIIAAAPDNVAAKRLKVLIAKLSKTQKGNPLPKFTATTTRGEKASHNFCKKKIGIIYAWASWNYDSQNYLRQLNEYKLQHADHVEILTISLDMSRQGVADVFRRGDYYLPTICDEQVWNSKTVQDIAITQISEFILINRKGLIHSRHTDISQLKEEIEKIK